MQFAELSCSRVSASATRLTISSIAPSPTLPPQSHRTTHSRHSPALDPEGTREQVGDMHLVGFRDQDRVPISEGPARESKVTGDGWLTFSGVKHQELAPSSNFEHSSMGQTAGLA